MVTKYPNIWVKVSKDSFRVCCKCDKRVLNMAKKWAKINSNSIEMNQNWTQNGPWRFKAFPLKNGGEMAKKKNLPENRWKINIRDCKIGP